jgi:hypothetical protein
LLGNGELKHVPAATNHCGNGFGKKHIHANDLLKGKKTILKPLKAMNSILFSRSYEGDVRPDQKEEKRREDTFVL